jgi:predicted PurR-regulated permease PerM
MILCLVIGLAAYLGLTILGVKYALLLGIIAGLTEIIPYVGPFIGAIPGVFIAFSDSLPKVIMVAVMYFLIQQLENYILVPKVMQRTTGINAVVVMAAILIGGKLGGIIGALLAVPVVTMLEVFLLEKFPYMKQVEEK